eukprot:CAMPEP_0114531470 /NCGR_PEP_ID=MMETSP0109-20121206/26081_1 /TAXON_ID=29199 /ORGANISM="Chlorarachnion reptans, Strain CCCM449" /LENGTH=1498 /DNA_ID=CAMNT_0001714333 /DNA_START=115 /DNA_END=4611 /DNA_ORIENTATION=+
MEADRKAAADADHELLSEPSNHFKPRGEAGYVGLDNQGATCYLNSLIQTMYMTPKLREALYSLTDEELGAEFIDQDDGPAQHDVDALTAMGFPESSVIKALTKHPGDRENAMEWLFTYDPSTDPESTKEGAAGSKKPKGKAWKIPIALQRLFSELELLDQRSVSTKQLTDSFGWKGGQANVQHDIHELNRILIDALHKSLQTTKCARLCDSLYKAEQVTRINCMECGYLSERKEVYMDLTLPVQESPNVVESLRELTQFEVMHGSEQYRCSRCNKKVDAVRATKLINTPEILTLSLARFVFNRITFQRQKVTKKFAFPLSLDLSPSLDDEDFTKGARDYYENWKKERARQVAEEKAKEERKKSEAKASGLPYDGDIAQARKAGDRDAIRQIMKYNQKKQSAIVAKESETQKDGDGKNSEGKETKSMKDEKAGLLADIKSEITRRETLMKDVIADPNSSHIYELRAVLIHIGTAYSGHYHAYIRGSDAKDKNGGMSAQWYDFNDASVTSIPTSYLAKQYGGASENAYMLVYMKRGSHKDPKGPAQVPSNLKGAIEKRNLEMIPRRKRYEVLVNQLTVYLHTEALYKVEEGYLVPAEKRGEAISLVLDRRTPVKKAKEIIGSRLGLSEEKLSSLLLNVMIRPEGEDVGLQCGKELSDGEMTLEIAGVNPHANNLFVWNGKTVNGVSYKPDPDVGKFVFRCIYYKMDEEPLAMKIAVPLMCTLGDLAKVLHEKVGLPDDHDKIMYHLMYQGKDGIVMHIDKDRGCLVKEIGLRTKGVVLGAELNSGQDPGNSVTQAYFQEDSNRVNLVVFDTIHKNAQGGNTRHEVSVMRKGSLKLFKSVIKKRIPDLPESISIRHLLKKGHPGCLYKDESATLESVGLTEPLMEVLVEPGPGLGSDEICLLYSIQHLNNKHADRVPINVNLNHTLGEVKMQVLKHAGVTSEQVDAKEIGVHTTKGDPKYFPGLYQRDRLLPDEKITVADAGFANGGSIWLQEAKRSVDGTARLNIYLYRDLRGRQTLRQFQDSRAKLQKMVTNGQSGDPSLFCVEPEPEEKLPYDGDMQKATMARDTKAIRIIMKHRSKNKGKPKEKPKTELKALFELPFLTALTLFDLKSALFHHPARKLVTVSSASPSPNSVALSLRHMRVYLLKSNLALGQLVRSDDESLLTQGVVGDMDIAVEITSDPQPSLTSCALNLKTTLCCKSVDAEKEIMLKRSPPAEKPSDAKNSGKDGKEAKGGEGQQVRKKAKLESAEGESSENVYEVVVGPVPPPALLCDISVSRAPKTGGAATELQPYNPWENLEPLKALASKNNGEVIKKMDFSKLPKNIEEALITELKARAQRVKAIEPKDLTGLKCTLADLRRACAEATGMRPDEFYILKFFFRGLSWKILTPGLRDKMLSENKMVTEDDKRVDDLGNHMEEEDSGVSEDLISLTDSPLNFRDGDFVAVLKRDEFGASHTFDDLESVVSRMGPRAFITSRKVQEPAGTVQRFTPKEQILRIDI